LSFTIFGLQNAASGSVSAHTAYLTTQQSGASPDTAPNDLTGSVQSTLRSSELGILGLQNSGSLASIGLLPWSSSNPAGSTNGLSFAIISSGNANSYTSRTSSGFNGAPNVPTSITPSSFTSGSVTADLFEFDPGLGTSQQAVYDGDFTFNSDGTLDFTSVVPAPEPSVYAIFGVGLLWLGFRHQLRRNSI